MPLVLGGELTPRLLLVGAGKLGSLFGETFRDLYPNGYIVATHRTETKPVPFANLSVNGIDVVKRAWYRDIPKLTTPYDWVVFTPAFGSVGGTLDQASPEELREAVRYSYTPLRRLEQSGLASRIVACSAHLQLELLQKIYRAMMRPKGLIESWVKRGSPQPARYLLRSALFESRSSKQILACLLRDRNNRSVYDPLVKAMFGRVVEPADVRDVFVKELLQSEYEVAQDAVRKFSDQEPLAPELRMTSADDLRVAIRRLFNLTAPGVVSVINRTVWVENF